MMCTRAVAEQVEMRGGPDKRLGRSRGRRWGSAAGRAVRQRSVQDDPLLGGCLPLEVICFLELST